MESCALIDALKWLTGRTAQQWFVGAGLYLAATLPSFGQTYLFDRIQLYNETSNTTVMVAKPDNITSNVGLVMPTTTPVAGQVLSISSVSSGTVNMGWSSTSVGTKPPSQRLTAAQTAAEPGGMSVPVTANKKYTISGILLVNRESSGSDNIAIKVTAPTGTADVDLIVRCYNCPANTTNALQYTTTSTPLTSSTIDPAGSGTADYAQYAYGVECFVAVGANDGLVTITATNAGANTNNVVLGAQSYILSQEIQ